jgi:tetratricopeptide (TPR) repeat protein
MMRNRIRVAAVVVVAALALVPVAQAAGVSAVTEDQASMSAEEHYKRAKTYAKAGKADLAMADLDLAIALDPEMGAAYYDRAGLYFQKGDLDRSIADYTQTIKLLPTFPPAYRAADVSAGLSGAGHGTHR